MKDIGAVLKNARENKEFTQKQVMELTGINKKSLSGYENNVAEPDFPHRFRWQTASSSYLLQH